MSDLQLYTKVACYIDGLQLTEESSVTIKPSSGAKEVNTVQKGFAGFSPGSAKIEIEVKNAIPAAGFEYDPTADIQNLTTKEFAFYAAGKTMVTKGVILTANFGHAVDNESTLEFTATCQYALWQ
jgi:hypothetical protein